MMITPRLFDDVLQNSFYISLEILDMVKVFFYFNLQLLIPRENYDYVDKERPYPLEIKCKENVIALNVT